MQFEAALIEQQGTKFAVVAAPKHITDNFFYSQRVMKAFGQHFPGTPIVLTSRDSNGALRRFGRKDMAKILAAIPQESIAFQPYDIEW